MLTPRVSWTGAPNDFYNAHPTIGDLSTLVGAYYEVAAP